MNDIVVEREKTKSVVKSFDLDRILKFHRKFQKEALSVSKEERNKIIKTKYPSLYDRAIQEIECLGELTLRAVNPSIYDSPKNTIWRTIGIYVNEDL